MWISNLDRLPTKLRMISWGLLVSPVCGLCQVDSETRDHLLLTCKYSVIIWTLVHQRLRTPSRVFHNWTDLILWTKRRSSTSPATLRKLVAHAIVYALWKQRNNFIHNLRFIPATIIFKNIDRKIINTINARRHLKNFRNLMGFWLF